MSNTHRNGNVSVVEAFFAAFGRGDLDGIVDTFHPDVALTAVREGARSGAQIYGSYRGRDGVRTLVSNLSQAFDTESFSVDHIVGDGPVVFASGQFVHHVKSSGKPFASDWALRCEIKDGKIAAYHFFEDSAALAQASQG